MPNVRNQHKLPNGHCPRVHSQLHPADRNILLLDQVHGNRVAGAQRVVTVRIRGRVVGLVDEHGNVEVVVHAPTSAQREMIAITLVREHWMWRVSAVRGRPDLSEKVSVIPSTLVTVLDSDSSR